MTGRRALPDGFNVLGLTAASAPRRTPSTPASGAALCVGPPGPASDADVPTGRPCRRSTPWRWPGGERARGDRRVASSTSRSASPRRPRPAAVRAAAAARRSSSDRSATRTPPACSTLRTRDRRALPGLVRRRGRPRRASDRHRRRVGRLHARVPRLLRPGRPGRRRRARLPVLPQHAARARHRAGRRSPSGPRPDGRRRPSCSTPPGRSTASSSRQPVEPDRHGAATPSGSPSWSAWCAGARRAADRRRDLPRHHVRPAGRAPAARRRPTARSSSTASPSTCR